MVVTETRTPLRARPRVVLTMALAQFGLFFALLTPVFASLTVKVQTLVPADEVVGSLGLVMSVGAVAALLANPVFGRISDHTTGRFGRRRPWLVAGSLGLLASVAVIAVTDSLTVVVLAWFTGQVCANAALAAYVATMADQVPQFQRGQVSGLIGVMQNVGVLAAAYAAVIFGQNLVALFVVPGLIGMAFVVLYAIVLPDRPLPRRPPSRHTWLQTFWVNPRRHPDFAFAWVSRFMVILAAFMFTTYRLLYLQHELGLPAAEATGVMATGVLVYTVAVILAAQVSGWLSDRLRRRKVFVFASTLGFGVGMVMLAQTNTVGAFYAAEAVLGLAYGVYVAVDLALVVDVLPDPDDAAKDLGVFNIANAFPQAIAPAFGALLLGAGGGRNYQLLLFVAAVVCVVGALAVLPVRKVR